MSEEHLGEIGYRNRKEWRNDVLKTNRVQRFEGLNSDWKKYTKGRNIVDELPKKIVDKLYDLELVHPSGEGFPKQNELLANLENNKYPSHLGEIDSIDPIVDFINEYRVVGGGEEM